MKIHIKSDGTRRGTRITDEHGEVVERVKLVSLSFGPEGARAWLHMDVEPVEVETFADAVSLASIDDCLREAGLL